MLTFPEAPARDAEKTLAGALGFRPGERIMSANRPLRFGLTLLELIVVLVILVAVAGIVIPLLPDAVLRSHTAVGSTNTSEITRFVQLYQRTYQSMPNDLDNLATSAGVIEY